MQTKHQKIANIIEKYRPGFEEIYLDGYYDGASKNSEEIAKNFLKDGFDAEIISKSIPLPLERIKELEKEI